MKEEDSLLYRTVIIKPTWGTDAVYKVLDNQQVVNNQGYFTRKDLKNIWHEEKYAERRGELLELMKKFQLCYQIPGNKNAFIAPQLLSDNQQKYDWDESSNLILRYTYPDFMPKGIITRFIVAMHQYIDQQKYVWKSGVILAKDSARAEVIEYYGKREIRMRVTGNNQKKLMTIVTHELDKINDSYNRRLNYQKLIPCNCETCHGSQKPYFYELKKLEERRNNGKRTIECGNYPYIDVEVLSLIDDIFLTKIPELTYDDCSPVSIFKTRELPNIEINIPINLETQATAGDNINQSGSNIGMGINNGKATAENITGNINQSPSQKSTPSQENTIQNETEKPAANLWHLGNKLALIGILIAVIFGLFSGLFTEEGRKILNLDKQEQPEQINDSE